MTLHLTLDDVDPTFNEMSSLFSLFRFTSCNETAKLGAYCSEGKCTTRFFLNVADTDECAGSDWVGTCRRVDNIVERF